MQTSRVPRLLALLSHSREVDLVASGKDEMLNSPAFFDVAQKLDKLEWYTVDVRYLY